MGTVETVYQPKDLQRGYRRVLDDAKSRGRVVIRDSDGTSMTVMPSSEVTRRGELIEYMQGFLGLTHAHAASPESRHVSQFGSYAWASTLPESELDQLVQEMAEALTVALGAHSLQPLDALVREWRATAEVWSDPDLATSLTQTVDADDHEVL